MEAKFTVALFAKIVVACWLLAQTAMWTTEVRQRGIRPWLQASMQQSYAQYLNSLTGRQWLRLGVWFVIIFHVLLVGFCLVFPYSQ